MPGSRDFGIECKCTSMVNQRIACGSICHACEQACSHGFGESAMQFLYCSCTDVENTALQQSVQLNEP